MGSVVAVVSLAAFVAWLCRKGIIGRPLSKSSRDNAVHDIPEKPSRTTELHRGIPSGTFAADGLGGTTHPKRPSYGDVAERYGGTGTSDRGTRKDRLGETASTANFTSSRTVPELPNSLSLALSREGAVNVRGSSGKAGSDPPGTKGKDALGVLQAVLVSAEEIAKMSSIAGISEAATLVSVLVRLFADSRDNAARSDSRVRWCRSILVMLQRAETLLEKVRWTGIVTRFV